MGYLSLDIQRVSNGAYVAYNTRHRIYGVGDSPSEALADLGGAVEELRVLYEEMLNNNDLSEEHRSGVESLLRWLVADFALL